MKLKIIYAALGAVLLCCVILTVIIFAAAPSDKAQIISNGEILYEIDLKNVEDKVLEIRNGDEFNIVEIKDGKICVTDASCSDKVCVKTGELSSNMPIVCLPNKLVIKLVSDENGADGVLR